MSEANAARLAADLANAQAKVAQYERWAKGASEGSKVLERLNHWRSQVQGLQTAVNTARTASVAASSGAAAAEVAAASEVAAGAGAVEATAARTAGQVVLRGASSVATKPSFIAGVGRAIVAAVWPPKPPPAIVTVLIVGTVLAAGGAYAASTSGDDDGDGGGSDNQSVQQSNLCQGDNPPSICPSDEDGPGAGADDDSDTDDTNQSQQNTGDDDDGNSDDDDSDDEDQAINQSNVCAADDPPSACSAGGSEGEGERGSAAGGPDDGIVAGNFNNLEELGDFGDVSVNRVSLYFPSDGGRVEGDGALVFDEFPWGDFIFQLSQSIGDIGEDIGCSGLIFAPNPDADECDPEANNVESPPEYAACLAHFAIFFTFSGDENPPAEKLGTVEIVIEVDPEDDCPADAQAGSGAGEPMTSDFNALLDRETGRGTGVLIGDALPLTFIFEE